MGADDLVDYLKRMQAHNPSFFYAIQESSTTDINNNNIFWADPSFRMNYNYFGDTIRLDIAPHHYSLPLVIITGVNHHAQPVLFGCGLLPHSHSPASSYFWLLQNWLHAMSGNYPVSITTQPDHHIQMAVQQVLPQTRHRFSKWAIFRQTIEKLPPQSSSFHNEFHNCIHETETVNEFESCWQTVLHRYSLMDNEWLHSIYNTRHQWVPAYMKLTFFGQLLLPQQEDEDMLLFFFNGYVNSTTSIQTLPKQYESALTSWQEMELRADFDTATTIPVLKTPSPMEKQAASLYTRRAFLKFQEELVETLANQATKLDDDDEEEDSCVTTTYRVAKFGDDEQQEKKKVHIVRFNSLEMKAICSCHMFEFSGIICRHALSVFRAQNVLTLPSQYILKRWTRDAKRGGEYVPELLLTSNNSQDSLTVRYKNLRQEALKFVEEGAKSVHIYNTALNALQVAAKKVAASKKRVNHYGILLNGGNQETDMDKGSQQMSYQTNKGEKEKNINELTSELDNTNQRCEVYRANLLAVLRDTEEQKLKLSVKVQNARLSLKE